jgi:hypothetical protein
MSATGKVDHPTGEKNIKPDCVLDYNLKMGAVDTADMINSFVERAGKTTKWYRKIFSPSDQHCCPQWPLFTAS